MQNSDIPPTSDQNAVWPPKIERPDLAAYEDRETDRLNRMAGLALKFASIALGCLVVSLLMAVLNFVRLYELLVVADMTIVIVWPILTLVSLSYLCQAWSCPAVRKAGAVVVFNVLLYIFVAIPVFFVRHGPPG